jgi:hypothetical protein
MVSVTLNLDRNKTIRLFYTKVEGPPPAGGGSTVGFQFKSTLEQAEQVKALLYSELPNVNRIELTLGIPTTPPPPGAGEEHSMDVWFVGGSGVPYEFIRGIVEGILNPLGILCGNQLNSYYGAGSSSYGSTWWFKFQGDPSTAVSAMYYGLKAVSQTPIPGTTYRLNPEFKLALDGGAGRGEWVSLPPPPITLPPAPTPHSMNIFFNGPIGVPCEQMLTQIMNLVYQRLGISIGGDMGCGAW